MLTNSWIVQAQFLNMATSKTVEIMRSAIDIAVSSAVISAPFNIAAIPYNVVFDNSETAALCNVQKCQV